MSKIFKLNETDLRRMVHSVINEIMSMEGEGEQPQYEGDRYYFDAGFGNGNERPYKADNDNPFTAEGAVGQNYEEFVSQLQEYVNQKLQEFESRKGRIQKAFDNWLAIAKERHGKFTRPTQQKHERQVKWDNERRGTSYPDFLKPGGFDYSMHDRYLKDIEREEEDNKKWLANELRIDVDMPDGNKEPGAVFGRKWGDFAQIAPKRKTFQIDPNNVEEAAQQAWNLFNEYASRVKEVVGWWMWQWSTFNPAIKPILTPEVGAEIEHVADEIRDYYASKRSGEYCGD